jgi:hypothetical protein
MEQSVEVTFDRKAVCAVQVDDANDNAALIAPERRERRERWEER